MSSNSVLPEKDLCDPDSEHQASLEQVAQIFGGSATAVFVEPKCDVIPARLRSAAGSDSAAEWELPWQVIGIECGAASQGLCAIVFQTEQQLAEFIRDNPALADTLVTNWLESNFVLWLRSDWMPKIVSFDSISWVSEGVIPVAAPGFELRHFVFRHGHVAAVQFDRLKWPGELATHFQIVLLQALFGHRYRRVGRRKAVLNELFWAHFLAKRMELVYHVQREAFFRPRQDTQELEQVAHEQLVQLTAQGLQQAAVLEPQQFPVSEINLPIIKRLVQQMKIAVAVNTSGEKDALLQFVAQCVEVRKDSDVTVAEFRLANAQYCQKKNLPPYPKSVFERQLPEVLRQKFGVAKSHDLRRTSHDGTEHCHRGFRGLMLCLEGKAAAPALSSQTGAAS